MDMPLCSRRAWTTCQGPVDPSRLTTYPHPGCYDDGVVLPRFQIRHSDRKTVGVTIITTIHIQRPTLLYLYQFYPGKTQTSVPLLWLWHINRDASGPISGKPFRRRRPVA